MEHNFLNRSFNRVAEQLDDVVDTPEEGARLLKELINQDRLNFVTQVVSFCLQGLHNAREDYYHRNFRSVSQKKKIYWDRIKLWEFHYERALQMLAGKRFDGRALGRDREEFKSLVHRQRSEDIREVRNLLLGEIDALEIVFAPFFAKED